MKNSRKVPCYLILAILSFTVAACTNPSGNTALPMFPLGGSGNAAKLNAEDFGIGAKVHGTYGVKNEAEWKAAVTAISGGVNQNYVINIIRDFPLTGVATDTFGSASGIKVSIRGKRTISLSVNGSLLRIAGNQSIIIRNLNLKGNSSNNTSLVYVNGASLWMKESAAVSGNTVTDSNAFGGGVYVTGG